MVKALGTTREILTLLHELRQFMVYMSREIKALREDNLNHCPYCGSVEEVEEIFPHKT